MFAQYQAVIMRKQVKQKLYFKTMVSFTSYWLSMEKLVTYGLLPKRKRINLGVMFSFFANRKHKKVTQSLNYKSPVQSFLLFSLRSSEWKPVPRSKKVFLRRLKRSRQTNKQKKTLKVSLKGNIHAHFAYLLKNKINSQTKKRFNTESLILHE